MANLVIPKKDVETLLSSRDIGTEEFKNVTDNINPNTIYTNQELKTNEIFNGNFSNGLAISDLVGVFARAVNSASNHLMPVDKLIGEIIESIQEFENEVSSEDEILLSEKVKLAYDKFFDSGIALDILTSNGNIFIGSKIDENIKPIFDQDDHIKGYAFHFTLNINYMNADEHKRVQINLDHIDTEYLIFLLEVALKRKGDLIKLYKDRGDNVFTSISEDEYYEDEG